MEYPQPFDSSEERSMHTRSNVQRRSTGQRCIICHAKSSKESTLSFHRFPKDPKQSDIWAKIIGLKFVLAASVMTRLKFRVCSNHFTKSDYYASGKILLDGTIPTVCPTSAASTISFSTMRNSINEKLSSYRASVPADERLDEREPTNQEDSSHSDDNSVEINVEDSLSNSGQDSTTNEVQMPSEIIIKTEDNGLSFSGCLDENNTISPTKETADTSIDNAQMHVCQNLEDPSSVPRVPLLEIQATTSTPHVISLVAETRNAKRNAETVTAQSLTQDCHKVEDSGEFESRFMNFFRSFRTRIERLDEDKKNELQFQFILMLRKIETGNL